MIDGTAVLLGIWHDISERVRSENKLKRSELMLNETQQLTHSGSWEQDIITGKNYWSKEAFNIFGLPITDEGPSTEAFDKMIYPEDRDKYLDAIRKALHAGENSSFDLRIVLESGEVKHIHAIGQPFFNEQGKLTKLHGAIMDITQRKKAEETIRQKEELLRTFIEYTPAAIAMLDRNMVYIAASKVWTTSYKLNYTQIIGKSHYEVFPDIPDVWKEYHRRCLAGEVLSCEEDPFVRESGHVEWIKWEIRPWYEKENEVGGIVMFTEVITEQKDAKEALIRAKEQAEQAAIAKSEFLSTMSHEIRTPMNAVIGFTHLLMQNPREDQVEYLKTLKFSAENLLVLINDILDFNKIEAGMIVFEEVDFSIKDLVSNIREAMVQKAREKDIQLKLLVDDELPDVLIGDPVRLGQIITNLVSNAVKFTDKGKVVITASLINRDDKKTVIGFEVKDTGIGIPEDKQQYIFESFTQASSNTTRRFGGTGLGLAITRRLLELQGSSIELKSKVGEGSVFSFELTFQNSWSKLEKPGIITSLSKESLSGTRLLIAEDNQTNVLLAQQFFKQWDVECDVAENGIIALQLVQTNDYDLVLMDLQMPEMDGYDTTRKIRELADTKYKQLPVIALTASAMLNIQDRAFLVGMNAYISKPFNPDELYLKIKQFRKKHTT
jgi:PAS domain S-box-containing protein